MEGTTPVGRLSHSMAFDETTGSVFLYSGYNGKDYLQDFWVYPLLPSFPSLLRLCIAAIRKGTQIEDYVKVNQSRLPLELQERLLCSSAPLLSSEPRWHLLEETVLPDPRSGGMMVANNGTLSVLGGGDGESTYDINLRQYKDGKWQDINHWKLGGNSEYGVTACIYQNTYLAYLAEKSLFALYNEGSPPRRRRLLIRKQEKEDWLCGPVAGDVSYSIDNQIPVLHVYDDKAFLFFDYKESIYCTHLQPYLSELAHQEESQQPPSSISWVELRCEDEWKVEPVCGCFWQNLFFRFTETALTVLDLCTVDYSASSPIRVQLWKKVPYKEGQKLVLGQDGTLLCGKLPRFLGFGGYSLSDPHYMGITSIIEVAEDWSVVNVKSEDCKKNSIIPIASD